MLYNLPNLFSQTPNPFSTTQYSFIIMPNLDFSNTEIAFERRTNSELWQMSWLFGLMNRSWLVSLGSKLTLLALKMRLPIQSIIKATIFKQFCGGINVEECAKSIQNMSDYGVLTILDYGVEAKTSEADFDNTVAANIKSIHFAAKNQKVPIISCKISGLARFALLEKIDARQPLTDAEKAEYDRAIQRIDKICMEAADNEIGVFIDAEESWVQDTIDDIALLLMEKYNKNRVIVYNTFQMYRHDRLAYLKQSYELSKEKGFLLGAKIVRGAYMEKERARAEQMKYPSPIQISKSVTDHDYNEAIRFCIEHYTEIGSCLASHNQVSCMYQATEILEKAIPQKHPHLSFCQLYGMSDNLTYNLAKAGFNISKYVPYGEVKEVIPYLIRRAKENSSVNGEMGRELSFITQEINRRRQAKK